jgi:serine protease Do
MRLFLLGLMVLALASRPQIALAAEQDDEQSKDRAADNQREEPATRAYLGIGVEPLHPSLFGHLAELLHGGEGVRIVQVAEDSPADDAGLRPNDVLLRYDDQRIFTAEQLARLVSLDKPGREVTLGIIRSGKSKKVNVTLGERREVAAPEHRALRPPINGRESRRAERAEKADQWDTFDSLTLSRIDENRFQATIKYRNKDGKLVSHRFKGTREEIRNDIEGETDLPANERGHLLRALGLHHHAVPLDMPELWVLPDGRVILEMPEPESPESEDSEQESAF